MREMKDSGIEWVGAIPAAWGVHRIASHFQEIKEKNTANAYSNALQFKMGKIIAKPQKWDEDETNETYSAYTVVHPNTIMINGLNLEFDFVTQRVARVECNGIITSAYIALSPRDDINAEYICYLLKSYDACRAFHSMGRGLRKILSYSELKNKPIVVPPLAEQERIAAFLDAECAEIDAVLEKTRASIEEYKKLKQAVITQAVTKGIRGDRPMKDSGIEWIGDIPAEWDVLNLVAHTSMLTPMRDRPENLDGPIPWVRIEDFEGKYIESSKAGLGVSMKTVKEMNLKVYPVGTILCTSSCIMGKCAIVSRELVSNQRFIGIIPDQTTDKTYLYYLMTSNAERMNFLSTGALQANLSRSAFEHLKVQFPPYSEQQEIAAYLDDKCEKIDELILKKQQYLTEIENYKKSLIYEYVTGKKEVLPL